MMFTRVRGTTNSYRTAAIIAAAVAAAAANPAPAAAQTGSFFAVLNNQRSNGDSRNSVTFFDANDLASGPMFSVFTGYERTGSDYTDPSAIDVDPVTGDVYVIEFDNTLSAGAVGLGTSPPYPDDMAGDLDLFRINFATVYNNWVANFKGKDVRALGLVGQNAPSAPNATNLDYVTFGAPPPDGTQPAFDGTHSNTVVLANSIVKVGEVKRNWNPDAAPFFPYAFTFIDSNNLFLVDDSSAFTTTDTAETDHEYRIFNRVSASPGMANGAVLDHLDGGFNNGTSESWNSTRIGKVALDVTGHSEPESAAFYADPLTGVRGVWVTESDSVNNLGGDDVAFLQLDANNNSLGYRMLSTGAPAFALDNDPAGAGTATNDGKADNIFVDKDSGDVIIMESGFNDTAGGIGLGDIEPSVLRLNINSYDNAGQIELGTWEAKVTLAPMKDTGATGLVRGQWTSWDSVNDRLIVAMTGAGAETPPNQMDIYVLDLKAGSPTYGQTTSFLNVDDSVSLFLGDSFGDKVAAFTLVPAADADFDNDGDVDGADFLTWQKNIGSGTTNATGDANGEGQVTGADLAIWRSQFPQAPAVGAAGAVPEPASLALAACALGLLAARRRAV